MFSASAGSLVSPFHVLTAGHCVYDFDASSPGFYATSSYWVIPGQTDVQAPFATDGWGRWGSDKPFGLARATGSMIWGEQQ